MTKSNPQTEASVSAYYAALTQHIVENQLTFHHGLWGPDTTSQQEAFQRSDQTLVQGCELAPGQKVLDAGCGVGGGAIMLAREYGVQVTGLTNCEPHVAVAAEQAEQQGVGHLVEFVHGDFRDLPFPDSCFDVVFNNNSFCYVPVPDQVHYLQGVYRVLKPGGRWQALDPLMNDVPMSESQQTINQRMLWGFRTPPWATWREVFAALEEAGFEDIQHQDLASEIVRDTEITRDKWLVYLFLRPVPSGAPNEAYHRELMQAALDYDQGIKDGVCTYYFMSGMRPA